MLLLCCITEVPLATSGKAELTDDVVHVATLSAKLPPKLMAAHADLLEDITAMIEHDGAADDAGAGAELYDDVGELLETGPEAKDSCVSCVPASCY
jgi:hypothetical protein